ncbi:peptide synthetase [Paraburkholderia bryophila]|uniref:peptide synthetase n=1 Tax=Paraburkholderia bryophila TaxID=420952 RepID=UPI0023499E58|nr:peptide synthetase [Paraburkholderia bryophila]WCM23880.1 peptide synthetase [Paraburkholderia bryophila]
MTQALPPLFDFTPFVGRSEHYVSLIKQFAQAHAFRSASVDELVLDNDFHRRPLRPEDFEFLKFMKPVRADNVSRLPSLAANRTLLSIYELDVLRAPHTADSADWQRFADFYRDDVRTLGAEIAPFLENYAFSYLSSEADPSRDLAAAGAQLRAIVDAELAFWDATFARLIRNDYLEEGLRFIMVQRWALAPTKRRALAQAQARGFLDTLPHDAHPALSGGFPEEGLLERVAGACGVTRQQHAYWQFYLPTSTAKCNLLSALGRRPGSAFAFAGAAFAAQAEWLAFGLALERACVHLQPAGKRPADAGALKAELVSRAERAFAHLAEKHGSLAYAQALQGLDAGDKLADRGRWDLGEQLRWLSAIERYCGFARQISTRIDAECPDIDRETFVEPHEMCSTTHVHNDHRLVTIEEGEMLFWGNVGMQLKMNRGDMVLIPDGRLHGSTVVSGECTYHQPIIPDDWVQALTAELDPAPAR